MTLKQFLLEHHHEIEKVIISRPIAAGTCEPKETKEFRIMISDAQNQFVHSPNSEFGKSLEAAEIIHFGMIDHYWMFGMDLELEYNGFGGYQTLTVDKTTFTFYKLTPCY